MTPPPSDGPERNARRVIDEGFLKARRAVHDRPFIKWLVGVLQTAVVTWVVVYFIEPGRFWERWEIEVRGALPLHVYSSVQGPQGLDLPSHQLAFIVEVQNNSATPVPVSVALIDGCIAVHGMEVFPGLQPEETQRLEKMTMDELASETEDAMQRITLSGIVQRPDVIRPKSLGYVGVLFELSSAGATIGVPGSVSVRGNCSAIAVSSPQPGIAAVFSPGTPDEPQQTLRQEFPTGRLLLSFVIGTKSIPVEPSTMRGLRQVSGETWNELNYAAMFTNPETAYPPRKRKAK